MLMVFGDGSVKLMIVLTDVSLMFMKRKYQEGVWWSGARRKPKAQNFAKGKLCDVVARGGGRRQQMQIDWLGELLLQAWKLLQLMRRCDFAPRTNNHQTGKGPSSHGSGDLVSE